MNICVGVPIHVRDGHAGFVDRVIINPETNQVEGIVARADGLLDEDVIVPMDRIITASGEHLTVEATAEEMNLMERFSLSQYTEPPEDWLPPVDGPASIYLMPASPLMVGAMQMPHVGHPSSHEVELEERGEIEIGDDTRVYATDGEVGRLHRVLTAGYTDRGTHLVVETGRFLSHRERVVPIEHVRAMGDDRIDLDLTREQVEALGDFDAVEEQER